MRTGRPTPPVVLSAEERLTLEQWARRPTTAQGLAQRARLVLACASSKTNGEIAAAAGGTRQTGGRRRHRFVRQQLGGRLWWRGPAARRRRHSLGRKPGGRAVEGAAARRATQDHRCQVERVIALTLETV